MTPKQRKRTLDILEKILGKEEMERLHRLTINDEGLGYDMFGFEKESALIAYAVMLVLYKFWFRVESFGIENIPAQGRTIIVGNHSGGIPLDAAMIAVDIAAKMDPPRNLRSMVDLFAFKFPFLGIFMSRVGQLPGTRKNFEVLLRKEEIISVFPEGTKGLGKPFKERYQLKPFNVGHVELSLRYQTPLIPTAIIGAEEQYPLLYKVKSLAKVFGVPYFPVTYTFPHMGLIGLLPLPVKYYIYYGKPITFYNDMSPKEVLANPIRVRELANYVQDCVQHMINEGIAKRKGIFYG